MLLSRTASLALGQFGGFINFCRDRGEFVLPVRVLSALIMLWRGGEKVSTCNGLVIA